MSDPIAPDKSSGDAGPNHEVTLERQGARVNLRLIVPAEEVAAHVQSVTQAFRERARLPGFRRGKAPISMIRQRFRDEIREHVLDHMIPEHVSTELQSHELRPLHAPILDKVDFDPEGPLTIAVHFDVAPEIEVSGYTGLKAARQREPVTDDVVERALGDLRERAAKLDPVAEGEATVAHDYVRAAVALYPKDGKGKRLAEEDRYVHVGEERAIPGLNSQLEGMSVGDAREFVTRLGDVYPNDLLAGKEVTCRVEVKDIKRRHLPGIDDELAKDLGLADLEELRAKTSEDLDRQLELQAERDVDRQLLDQVLEANPIDAPASLVDERLEQEMRKAARELASQGIDPQYSVDWRSFRADREAAAERAVKEELLLDRIADAQEIEVDDPTVAEEIERHQSDGNTPVSTIVQQMRKDGSFEGLRRLMVRQHALDYIRRHATIEGAEDSSPSQAQSN